jgi:hypothetical protein
MKEVSREEFFKPIYQHKLDVHPRITNDRHPYTSEWSFHNLTTRPVYGKTVDRVEGGVCKTSYFLSEAMQ